MTLEGVDYSYARPGGAALAAAGKSFAVRYLNGSGKGLTQAELDDLRSHALAVAVVYESTAGRAKDGRAAGVADAQAASQLLAGLPSLGALPVYFAVDFDATPADQVAIDEYLRGAATVLGASRVGVYGGYWVVKRCWEAKTAAWLWQTYAWSGGQIYAPLHLYQYRNGQTINGGAVDFTRAMQTEFGQHPVGASAPVPAPAPAPAPVPTPAPAPAGRAYTVVPGDTLSGIAARFGTTYQELARINGIPNPNLIRAGQVLRLDGAAPAPAAPAPAPAPAPRTVTVRSGDSLSAIAAAHGTTWQRLYDLNRATIGPNPNVIRPGQVLHLP